MYMEEQHHNTNTAPSPSLKERGVGGESNRPRPESSVFFTERGLSYAGCPKQSCQLNVYDYLADIPGNTDTTDLVEVQFKNTRKGYYHNSNHLPLEKGDVVAGGGFAGTRHWHGDAHRQAGAAADETHAAQEPR